MNFPNDQLWKQVRAININAQHPHAQLFGSAIYRRAGLPTQETRAAQERVNNANLATSGAPSYGFYACIEVLNNESAAHAFPHYSSGNIYRGIRISGAGADLHYEGENPGPYRVNYFKQTNTSQDDWTDLIELTRVLDNASDADYAREVRRVANVEEWMLYFAIETLADNKETNLANGNNGTGQGDDYSLYRGMLDRRFNILPYDLDTIFNQGNSRGNVQDSLFRITAVPVLNRFMKQPEFAPIYYRQLKRLIDTTLSPEQLNPLADQVLSRYVPASVIDSIKTFAAARNAYVLSQIPLAVTIAGNLPQVDGYYRSTNSTVSLIGRANVIETRSVLVDGAPAAWSAWNGRWSNTNVTLHAGINRVLVQSLEASGNEFDRATIDIWYDAGALTNVSGTVTVDTTWSPGAGPYLVIGPLMVPAGVTLAIEPGTTVYFAPGAGMTVQGRLRAEGTDREHIRLTRQPGTAENWDSISFSDSGVESRLTYVDFESSGSGGPSIDANSAIIYLDHVTFAGTTSQYVSLDNSSFIIRIRSFPPRPACH